MNHKIMVLAGMWAVVSACGTGQDPLAVALGNPNVLPVAMMSLPLASNVSGVSLQTPFSATNPNFTLYSPSYTGGTTAVLAPITGLVTQVDTAAQSVTIMANSRVSVQLSGVSGSSIIPGSYVVQDATVGIASTTFGSVKFAVLFDGVAVCPLTWLSASARSKMLAYSALSPCQ